MQTCQYVRAVVGRQSTWDYYRSRGTKVKVNEDSSLKSYTYLNIVGIDRNEKTYRLSYICPKCNKNQYIVAKEMTYGLYFEDVSYCSVCQLEKHEENKVHKALLLDDGYFQLIKPVLKNLLETGNIGIAGTGSFLARYRLEFKEIFDALETVSKNKFILSDGDPDIADKSIAIGRKIYNTESILDKVKNIVVPSIYYPQIKEMVNSKEPKINVFGFFEIPFIG